MIDSEVLAYGLFGLSLSASLTKVGRWLLHAHMRAIINAVQLSVGALIGLTPVRVIWLVMSGRSMLALIVAAITLLILVWSVPRWRALCGSVAQPSGEFPRWDEQQFHATRIWCGNRLRC
jgi:L-asparagine transporter-like permease